MRTRFFLISSLFLSLIINGQSFSKDYFTKTKWFTENKDSLFHKADTLKFIKYSNYGPNWAAKEYAEDGVSFYKGSDLVNLEFLKKSKLNLVEQNIANWTTSVKRGVWSWQFDAKNKLLKIYFNNNLLYSFNPLSETKIKIKSKFSGQNELFTTELTLVRIKL